MLETKVKKEVRVRTVSLKTLTILIGIVIKENDFSSYEEIANCINSKFNTSITIDDIVNFFAIEREEEDRRLTYKHYLGL